MFCINVEGSFGGRYILFQLRFLIYITNCPKSVLMSRWNIFALKWYIRAKHVKKSFLISVCKILFGITAAILVSFIFDLPKVAISVLILQFSMPIAVTSYLLAEKYGVDANAVAGLVVVSTLITVGISPILIAFLIA